MSTFTQLFKFITLVIDNTLDLQKNSKRIECYPKTL